MPDKTAVHPTAGWSGRDGFWKTLEGRLRPDPCIYHMEVGAEAKALHLPTASLGRPFREKERTKRGVTQAQFLFSLKTSVILHQSSIKL